MTPAARAIALFTAGLVAAAAAPTEPMRHLLGAELQMKLTDKQITDGGHWGQTFVGGDRLVVGDQGYSSTGT